MRKVLSGLCLFVLCGSLALAQPAKSAGKGAPRAARPSKVEPTLIEKVWRQLIGGVRTYDEPPERGNNPVPG